MSTLSVQNTINSAAFDVEAARVLDELRPALANVIEQLGTPVSRASELRRLLDLDQRLSWSVFNAATATDARTLATLLPGPRAMERFFVAAAAKGAPEMVVGKAREAFDRFQQAVARHARSRETFETMMGELGESDEPAGIPDIDVKNRRAAFRGTALQWGRQTRLYMGALMFHPSAQPGLLDKVMIRGLVGLHRTRRGVPLHSFMHYWRFAHKGDPVKSPPFEPLDPRESREDSIGLMPDFCSKPLPDLRGVLREDGYRACELSSKAIGAASEVAVFLGHIERAATASGPGTSIALAKVIDIPMQVQIGDVFLHKSIWDERPPEMKVYAWPLHGSTEFCEADLLPQTERAIYLGMGLNAAHTLEIPRYGEILSFAAERMGWNPADFRVFRCKVEYPLLYTRIRMLFQQAGTEK